MTHRPTTFWNLSNHPSETTWAEAQKAAARTWGGAGAPLALRDVPFPFVDPDADAPGIQALAVRLVQEVLKAGAGNGDPILVQGEFSLVVALVPRLGDAGLVPVCATTRRIAQEALQPDGTVHRAHVFEFVRFREYLPGQGNPVR